MSLVGRRESSPWPSSLHRMLRWDCSIVRTWRKREFVTCPVPLSCELKLFSIRRKLERLIGSRSKLQKGCASSLSSSFQMASCCWALRTPKEWTYGNGRKVRIPTSMPLRHSIRIYLDEWNRLYSTPLSDPAEAVENLAFFSDEEVFISYSIRGLM